MQFDHYTIRLLTVNDLEKYFSLIERNRPRLEDYFAGTVSKTLTKEATKKFLEEDVLKKLEAREYFPFIIEDTVNDRFVGYIDLKRIDWRIPKGEFGCYFDTEYTGKGLSKKAMMAVINYLFEEYKFIKLFLRTHESNKAARALAESCGFIVEGQIRKDHVTTKGEIIDLLYYGLVRN